MKLRCFYVYILLNGSNDVMYVGVTSDLLGRVWQHRKEEVPGFTKRYKVKKLAYYEVWDTAEQAIAREKQLKRWHRDWKFNLIRELNPKLLDTFEIFESM